MASAKRRRRKTGEGRQETGDERKEVRSPKTGDRSPKHPTPEEWNICRKQKIRTTIVREIFKYKAQFFFRTKWSLFRQMYFQNLNR
jgi:hypothetical protein